MNLHTHWLTTCQTSSFTGRLCHRNLLEVIVFGLFFATKIPSLTVDLKKMATEEVAREA